MPPTIPPTTPPTRDTLAVIETIAAARPAPDLYLPQFRIIETFKWYADVLSLVSASPYHKCITHEDGVDIDPLKEKSYPHVDASILQQLRKVLLKETMALFCSSTELSTATYILVTVKPWVYCRRLLRKLMPSPQRLYK